MDGCQRNCKTSSCPPPPFPPSPPRRPADLEKLEQRKGLDALVRVLPLQDGVARCVDAAVAQSQQERAAQRKIDAVGRELAVTFRGRFMPPMPATKQTLAQ